MRRAAAIAALAAVAAGLVVSGVSGSGSSLRTYASDRYAFEGRLPPGWLRAGDRLVPLISPREVLSVGTFPMPAGGGGNCGREPVVAIRRMRPGDALISIQEYVVTKRMRPELTRTFPPKDEQLDLDELRAGRISRATVPFSEAGRAFDALVYFRGRPSPGLRREASRVLGELVFERLGPASRRW